MKIGCAVLAGGKSRRFKDNKFLAKFKGKPLIRHVVDRVKEVFDEIYVVVKERRPFDEVLEDVKLITDKRRDITSPLVGIEAALEEIDTPYVFVVSGDMPFIERDPIKEIISYVAHGWEAVVPKTEKGFEPLFAVYSRSCLVYVKRSISRGETRVIGFFPNIRLLSLKPSWDERVFFNINTPEDLKRAEEIAKD